MNLRHHPIASGLILALGLPTAALAQQENTASDDLEVIVVTASRTPIKRKDVTGSVSVFTDREIDNRKPIVASDILRNSPGVSVNRSGGLSGVTQVRIRGSEADHVMVLIDGIEANDTGIGGGYNFANLLANDVEQIEVLRGPQSSLWGSGAVAGVISISTQKSDTPFNINGHLEGGSFNTYSAGLNLGGAGEKFNYRISGGYVSSDGENVSREGDERDGYQNKTLNLSAGYDFTDNFKLSGSWRRTESDNDFDGTSFVTGLPEDADKNTEATYNYAALRGQLASFEGAWDNQLGITYNNSESDNLTEGALDTGTRGTITRGYWQSSWLPGADDNNSLTFVAERILETYKQTVPDTTFGDANQDLSQFRNGFVGEYNHAWQSGWKLSLSGRHDNNEDFKDANTYRAGLLYDRLQKGWLLRAAYGTGVRNPNFVERFGYYAGDPTFIGNADLKPEQSRSWEVGTTLKTAGNFFRIDLTYFDEQLEDEINGFAPVPGQPGTNTAVNMDGTSKRQGAELASWFNFTDNLALYLAYTYLDAREPDDALEIRRPRHIASANLNYLFLNDRGKFNINADYNGEQEDLFFGPPSYAGERKTLDAYTLVGAMLSFRVVDNLEIYARGENLLDEDYEEVYGFRGQSRAGYLGFRVDWSL